jgi:hypothetical protein
VPLQAVERFIPSGPPPDPNAPGPTSLADPERIRRILSAAGFRDVAIDPWDVDLIIGRDLEEACAFLIDAGPVARILGAAAEAQRPEIHRALREAMSGRVTPNGLPLKAATWLVRARI